MSKRTHKKELERARAKRRAERRHQRRTRVIALVAIAAMALSVFAVAFLSQDGTPSPEVTDDPGAAGEQFGTEGDGGTPTDAGTEAGTEPDAAPTDASYENPQPVEAEPCPTGGDAPEPSLEPYDAAPEMTIDPEASYTATIETTCGTIELALDAAAAPQTVNNFVTLARDGYYDGVPFHRVMNGFMIQGGDPTGTGTGCVDAECSTQLPGYTIEDELTLAEELSAEHGGYPRGTLAMANTGQPDSGGAQFFIVQGVPGYPLPPQYAVFGEVTEGIEVVDRIAQGPTEGDLAVDPVRITGVTVEGP